MPVFVGAGTSSFMKGSDGVGVSNLTTTQRNALSGVKKGQFIFNESLNLAQYYDGNDWKSLDSPPTVSAIAIDGRASGTTGYIDGSTSTTQTIIISGSLFDTTGALVTFEGTQGSTGTVTPLSITRDNSSQITVTVNPSNFLEADDPYTVKVTNGSGLAGVLADAIDVNVPPTFATAAGSIGSTFETNTNFANLSSVAATDADNDPITHTISAGSLPSGVSLNTNGTLTGTVGSGLGVFTFTVQAATAKYTVTRQFTLTVSALPSGGNVTTSGNNRIHTFTSSGTFTSLFAAPVEVMVIGAGGGGAGAFSGGGGAGGIVHDPNGLQMAASSYTITVGQGGQGGNGWQAVNGMRGNNGGDSTAFGFTAKGGGGGGAFDWTYSGANAQQVAQVGGCGGGGAAVQSNMTASARNGATSNQGNFTGATSYGTSGGNGQSASQLTNYHGGGGGGASQSGVSATSVSGAGGNGQAISITGSSVTYAGGGGGSNQGGTAGAGGSGGGGAGTSSTTPGGNGTDGLGGGGGAAGYSGPASGSKMGGDGGDGVVIIKYDKDDL
jgi:hypothetical protein